MQNETEENLGPCKVCKVSQSLCRFAPVTAATAHSGDMIGYGINICITEGHSMCVVREGL